MQDTVMLASCFAIYKIYLTHSLIEKFCFDVNQDAYHEKNAISRYFSLI